MKNKHGAWLTLQPEILCPVRPISYHVDVWDKKQNGISGVQRTSWDRSGDLYLYLARLGGNSGPKWIRLKCYESHGIQIWAACSEARSPASNLAPEQLHQIEPLSALTPSSQDKEQTLSCSSCMENAGSLSAYRRSDDSNVVFPQLFIS